MVKIRFHSLSIYKKILLQTKFLQTKFFTSRKFISSSKWDNQNSDQHNNIIIELVKCAIEI